MWQSSFFFSSQKNSHGLEAGVLFSPFFPLVCLSSLLLSPQWLWGLYVLLPRESRTPASSLLQGGAGCPITLCQSREEALRERSGREKRDGTGANRAQSPDLNSNRVSSFQHGWPRFLVRNPGRNLLSTRCLTAQRGARASCPQVGVVRSGWPGGYKPGLPGVGGLVRGDRRTRCQRV